MIKENINSQNPKFVFGFLKTIQSCSSSCHSVIIIIVRLNLSYIKMLTLLLKERVYVFYSSFFIYLPKIPTIYITIN